MTKLTSSSLSLANVVAVVGCDGSGKSTLTGDLVKHLSQKRPTEFVYLGQSSGNILIFIKGLPLVGGIIGRYLVRRSERVHARDDASDKPKVPDATSALVIYLLSRWRYHKFQRVIAMSRRGTLVVADRYPQAEVPGFWFDGPGLKTIEGAGAFVRWLARRERRLYERMAAHLPALLIRLNIDAETAHARKPDHKLAMLHEKATVIPTIAFNGAHILDLDGRDPYPQVLEAALAATHAAIDCG